MNDTEQVRRAGDSALVGALLRRAELAGERLDRALEAHGLSLAKLGALRILIEAGEPLPLGQVAERLACVKSNVTQLVDRLEAERLVRRVADPQDRRVVLATVTEEGRRRYAAGARAQAEAEAELLGGLGPEEREQLWRLLERLGGEIGTH